jgi:uncharacterized damage-inducible protein DinB
MPMKELLLSYARYNGWANDLFLTSISSLTKEQQEQEMVSSFPSLWKTLHHINDATCIWWQRLQLQEHLTRPSDHFEGGFEEFAQSLRKIDQQWIDYAQKSGEHVFTHEFFYKNINGERYKSGVGQVMQHLFNHSTFHRGQLVTMMRQVGATVIPSSDFISWTRLK